VSAECLPTHQTRTGYTGRSCRPQSNEGPLRTPRQLAWSWGCCSSGNRPFGDCNDITGVRRTPSAKHVGPTLKLRASRCLATPAAGDFVHPTDDLGKPFKPSLNAGCLRCYPARWHRWRSSPSVPGAASKSVVAVVVVAVVAVAVVAVVVVVVIHARSECADTVRGKIYSWCERAAKFGLSDRCIRKLCNAGAIKGAKQFGTARMVPVSFKWKPQKPRPKPRVEKGKNGSS
jgi:hypothetical protein